MMKDELEKTALRSLFDLPRAVFRLWDDPSSDGVPEVRELGGEEERPPSA